MESDVRFKRRLLSTTLTLDMAINALPHIGVIWKSHPKTAGKPAAKGMQTRL